MSRSRQAPKLASEVSRRFGIQVESRYEDSWTLRWEDGPAASTLRAAVAELAPTLSPAIRASEWTYRRQVRPDSQALQLLQLARDGKIPEYANRSECEGLASRAVRDTDDPGRADDDRDLVMARRLAAEADGYAYRMAELLRDRGIAWLLPAADPDDRSGDTPGPGRPAAAADPANSRDALELLTHLYALPGPEHTGWQRQLRTLPVREAVERAVADPGPTQPAIAAALMLFSQLREELDNAELALLERGRAGDGITTPMSWERIGRALGVTHQAAWQLVTRLRAGAQRRRTTGRA